MSNRSSSPRKSCNCLIVPNEFSCFCQIVITLADGSLSQAITGIFSALRPIKCASPLQSLQIITFTTHFKQNVEQC